MAMIEVKGFDHHDDNVHAGMPPRIIQIDVTNSGSADQMVSSVISQFGPIDILVNNAGGGGVRKPLEEITDSEWERTFEINTKGTFICSAAVARHMIKNRRGVIINIAGASAHRTYPNYDAYGPAKAAVVAFTHQASLEWARYGIRVNGVSPGPIRDPESNWESKEPELAREVQMLPLKRAGSSGSFSAAMVAGLRH